MKNASGLLRTVPSYWVYFAVFAVFAALRLLVWSGSLLLADHDSVEYLRQIDLVANGGWKVLIDLPADATPGYVLFSTLFVKLGLPLLTAARWVSFLAGCSLLWLLWAFGRHWVDRPVLVAAGLLLAVHPVLLELSSAVLTEPIYIASVYFGFWLFTRYVSSPTIARGALLGLVFAWAFWCRTEGILFGAVIPFLQWVHRLMYSGAYSWKRLISWTAVFVFVFSLLCGAQVWRVSEKMGMWAINGRQAWHAILHHDDGKDYEQKLYGLDYHPGMINLEYIQANPDTLANLKQHAGEGALMQTMWFNLKDWVKNRMIVFLGWPGAVLMILGWWWLLTSGRRWEAWLGLMFLAANSVAPLMHNVVLRHIAVLTPIIVLFIGYALVHIGTALFPGSAVLRKAFPLAAAGLLIFSILPEKRARLAPPVYGYESSPLDYLGAAQALHADAREGEDLRVLSRKTFFAYRAGVPAEPMPFTDSQGMLRYALLNDVTHVWVQYRSERHYPFVKELANERIPDDLELIYETQSVWGTPMELYRVKREAADASEG